MPQRHKAASFYLDTLAYASLFAVVAVGGAAFLAPLAGFVALLFPASALLAGSLLLWRKPALYVGFMWWLWFLTPAVRRLVDYRVGYTDQSLVMLAPFLVTGVALLAVLTRLPQLRHAYRAPLAFIAFGLLYAYAVGFLNNGLATASFDLLNWGVPVIAGAYLLTHQQHAAAFRKVTQQAFGWGLLVMGVYGLVQYFYLPPWDAFWMENAALVSIGLPEPQEVRIFSTLNAPGPFATVVMAGLLLVFSGSGVTQVLGAVAGFAGFALSAVRAAWGGWIVGLIVVASSLPLRLRARLLGTLFLLAIIAVPLFTVSPVAPLLSQRLQTVTDLENDSSFNARLRLYADIARFTAGNTLGQGLGSTGVASTITNTEAELQTLDSGIIAVIYTFGILGGLYYVGGAVALFGATLRSGLRSRNLADAAYIGITVAALSQLPFGNAWSGVPGMVLWFFPCLYLATRQHHLVTAAQPTYTPPAPLSTTLAPAPKGSIKVFKR